MNAAVRNSRSSHGGFAIFEVGPVSVLALLGTFISVIGLGTTSAAERESPKPNIVLCMADDQGWGDVGYYGKSIAKTPVLDEMASVGLRMDRFYSAAPVCSPTRGSVLTGRNPNRFGCFEWGHSLPPQEITIAEALKQAGYTTGHFGKWHLGSVDARSDVSPGASGFDEWFSSPNFYDLDPLMSHNGRVVRTEGEGSEVTVAAAIEFMRSCAKDEQPFLAVVWFGSPHNPHAALEKDRQLYADQPVALQHYYGEITAMDRSIGMLRDELKQLKIDTNTVLWFTSDNGPQGPLHRNQPGSSGGLRDRKSTLWEGGIRVPAIIEWPAQIPQPRVTSVPAITSDIYPTLLEIAGVDIAEQPKPLDGISMLPWIQGQTAARPQPMGFWANFTTGQPMKSTEMLEALETQQASGEAEQPLPNEAAIRQARITDQLNVFAKRGLIGNAAWIDNRYKLHRRWDKQTDDVHYELYDLESDPTESQDLAGDMPERVTTMKQQLETWRQSVIRSLEGADYAPEVKRTSQKGAGAGENRNARVDMRPPVADPDVIRTARQYIEATSNTRADLEPILSAYDGPIEPVIESLIAVQEKRWDAQTGTIQAQNFTLPELREQYPEDLLYYYVPEGYVPAEPFGLLIFMHGGDQDTERESASRVVSDPQQDAGSYGLASHFRDAPFVVVGPSAPVNEKSWARWNLPEADDYIAAVIRECHYRFNIDRDRVFLGGQSMGGFGAYHLCQRLSDRIAGGVLCAGLWNVCNWQSMIGTPLFIRHGVNDAVAPGTPGKVARPRFTDVFYARAAHKLLTEAGAEHVYVEDSAGHSMSEAAESLTHLAAWMEQQRRDPFAARVVAVTPRGWNASVDAPTPEHRWVTIHEIGNGSLSFDQVKRTGPGPKRGESREAFDQQGFELVKRSVTAGSVDALNHGGNRMTITTQNVKRFSIWLHPRMIDFAKPLHLTINGRDSQLVPQASLLTALRSYDRREDWGLIYHAKVTFLGDEIAAESL